MVEKKELNEEQLNKLTGGVELNPPNKMETPTPTDTKPAYVANNVPNMLRDQGNGETTYGRQVDVENDNDGYVNPWK